MAFPSLTYGVFVYSDYLDKIDELKNAFSILRAHGVTRLDTARVYENSEKAINLCGVGNEFRITTKAAFFRPITESAEESFKDLGLKKVEIFLLHGPDNKTPSEIYGDVQKLYEQGRFNRFGVSNFSAEQTRELYEYAQSKGYILPTVYQANYNLLARKNEKLLFPVLRELGIAIQAYSPGAGGFLLRAPEQLKNAEEGSRWADASKNQLVGKMYQELYNKASTIEYSKQFGELAEKSGVTRLGLTYRWIRYHSALGEEDTIVFGARTNEQLEELLTEIEKGPLEGWIVERLAEMWKSVEEDSPVDNFELAKKLIQ